MDQHEVLNEQSIIVSTRHHQISDDRQNADGLRFQNNWSMRFRFTPAVTGHALTHRVSEGNFDPELIKAWDYLRLAIRRHVGPGRLRLRHADDSAL